jgi:hypothetical protein
MTSCQRQNTDGMMGESAIPRGGRSAKTPQRNEEVMEMVISPGKAMPRADGREEEQAQADHHELPELTGLLATARRELALHVHDQQLVCSACGAAWPCERAALAAFTLGAL